MKRNALEISKYIVNFFQEHEDLITNLKLQKLLYYVQGWYLGLYDESAFEGEFQAWVHGPVQPNVYAEFKRYRWHPILDPVEVPHLEDKLLRHIHEVLEVYGTESAYALEIRSHLEDPWMMARGHLPQDMESNAIISEASMRQFFRKMANEK